MHPGIEHDLQAYGRWCQGIWIGSPRSPQEFDERDFTIMSLGLGGEVGEVMGLVEAAAGGGAVDRIQAIKELGDVFYYWSMLCRALTLDPWRCWRMALPQGVELPPGVDQAAAALVRAAQSNQPPLNPFSLSSRCGEVLEQLKKRVRDDTFDPDKFALAMGRLAQAWCAMANRFGLRPSDLLRANIDKVEDRAARGVLRGSGDNR